MSCGPLDRLTEEFPNDLQQPDSPPLPTEGLRGTTLALSLLPHRERANYDPGDRLLVRASLLADDLFTSLGGKGGSDWAVLLVPLPARRVISLRPFEKDLVFSGRRFLGGKPIPLDEPDPMPSVYEHNWFNWDLSSKGIEPGRWLLFGFIQGFFTDVIRFRVGDPPGDEGVLWETGPSTVCTARLDVPRPEAPRIFEVPPTGDELWDVAGAEPGDDNRLIVVKRDEPYTGVVTTSAGPICRPLDPLDDRCWLPVAEVDSVRSGGDTRKDSMEPGRYLVRALVGDELRPPRSFVLLPASEP